MHSVLERMRPSKTDLMLVELAARNTPSLTRLTLTDSGSPDFYTRCVIDAFGKQEKASVATAEY